MSYVNRNAANTQSTTQRLIKRQEAIAILESCDERGAPLPFAIAFCTANEEKGTGGEYIRYQAAVWHVPGGRVRKNKSFEYVGTKKKGKPRNTNRWLRRIRGVDSDQLRTLDVQLMTEINGMPIR